MKRLYTTLLLSICFTISVVSQEFVNEIQIPPLITNPDAYDLDMIQTMHNFNPKGTDSLNVMVPTFAFEDFNNPGQTSILGPTLLWRYKHDLTPTVLNKLPEQSTCHWHGAHVPQIADGGPYQIIKPDTLWEPEFTVLDKSATMWYHPHAMDLTYKHVQMGLSGIIIVEDPEDDPDDPDDNMLVEIHKKIPTNYNVNDFPLIFQTKKFERDVATNQIIIQSEQGFKNKFYYLVNGIVDPVITLPKEMVRLRLLNGDGKFAFNFAFQKADGTSFPSHMIATDAGYMDRSYQKENILMAPGERTEFLLDLSEQPEGTELYVFNNVSGMPRGIIGNGTEGNTANSDRNLLKIVVGPASGIDSPITSFPIELHDLETPSLSEVDKKRNKEFRFGLFEDDKEKPIFSIDSALMDMMVVNDVVNLGDTELWTLENKTNAAHPWHIHDIHFWVTEVIDSNGVSLNPDDYPEIFKGPKDNVLVQRKWKLSYITTFDDFGTEILPTNSYMYHCHILPHEDKGMMGTFVVWDGTGDPPTGVNEDDLSFTSMNVFPNPAQNIVYLKGASEKVSTLRLLDLNGQLLKEMSLPSFDGAIEISTDQLPAGMLVMDWITAEGRGISRVMITK